MTRTASARLRIQLEQSGDAKSITENDIAELDAELRELLVRIAAQPSADAAAAELDELAELHGLLATLLFRYRIPLSKCLEDVVRVFDRWDDPDTRTYFHRAVAEGRIR